MTLAWTSGKVASSHSWYLTSLIHWKILSWYSLTPVPTEPIGVSVRNLRLQTPDSPWDQCGKRMETPEDSGSENLTVHLKHALCTAVFRESQERQENIRDIVTSLISWTNNIHSLTVLSLIHTGTNTCSWCTNKIKRVPALEAFVAGESCLPVWS